MKLERFQHIFNHFIPCVNRDPIRTYRGNLRSIVLKAFNNRCAICCRHQDELENPLQIHHIFPWASGGNSVIENAIPLCHDICHPIADLMAWSPEYLYDISRQARGERLNQLIYSSMKQPVEQTIFEADADNLSSNLSWEKRLSKIINSWTIHSQGYSSVPRENFMNISAQLLWSISKILTTLVPEQQSTLSWRNVSIPRNRVVGINLAEKARSLIKRVGNLKDHSKADTLIGMTHTISTHYRSFGYYSRAYMKDREYMNILLSDEECKAVESLPFRAYYLTAYCVDLSELKKEEARYLIQKALKWSLKSEDIHSIADTLVRVSEIELRLNKAEECLRCLEKKHDFGSAWDLINIDAPIVQAIAHKICMRAHAQLNNWPDVVAHYNEAISIAKKEKLEDQKRKILEIYNKLNLNDSKTDNLPNSADPKGWAAD